MNIDHINEILREIDQINFGELRKLDEKLSTLEEFLIKEERSMEAWKLELKGILEEFQGKINEQLKNQEKAIQGGIDNFNNLQVRIDSSHNDSTLKIDNFMEVKNEEIQAQFEKIKLHNKEFQKDISLKISALLKENTIFKNEIINSNKNNYLELNRVIDTSIKDRHEWEVTTLKNISESHDKNHERILSIITEQKNTSDNSHQSLRRMIYWMFSILLLFVVILMFLYLSILF